MSNAKFYILLTLILGFGSYTVYKLNQQPKVGVVDFQELVMNYDGMQDAMVDFENKAIVWEKEVDSLQTLLAGMAQDLELNSYDKETTVLKENNLIMMNQYVMKREHDISQLAQEEDNKLTSAVIIQVTEFIEEYANDNGFDIIYGRNEGNYVLHKSDEFDITRDLLTKLNENYQDV